MIMKKEDFVREYLNHHIENISPIDISEMIIQASELLNTIKKRGKKVLFFGNGASAAIASHAALDFTKQAKIRSLSFNDAALLTAFSNDYGYEHWIEHAIDFYGDKGDVGVFISSSGRSKNIINGTKKAREKGVYIITFSGFEEDNPLKITGDINFWIKSRAYNVIENIHQIWLMGICDLIIGKVEYSVK